mmetsp:Transcript_9557/g.28766  ORF Transcript_9557/g.28766 Transcript_9557/m.28766 type:complete len:132 (-) Transcript_9557:4133-4528(-)
MQVFHAFHRSFETKFDGFQPNAAVRTHCRTRASFADSNERKEYHSTCFQATQAAPERAAAHLSNRQHAFRMLRLRASAEEWTSGLYSYSHVTEGALKNRQSGDATPGNGMSVYYRNSLLPPGILQSDTNAG